jgi:hypothetical protein
MQLSAYMAANGLNDQGMADLLGCDRSYVTKLRRPNAAPAPPMMALIAEKTDGSVLPNDWFPSLQEEAA